MPQKQRWIITTSGSRSLDDVRKDVASKGFVIEDVLDQIGCVIGMATKSVAQQVREVAGVDDVSPEPPPINIGPSDGTIF